MRSRKTPTLISAIAAIALSSAAVFAAKPGQTTADLDLAPAAPPCTELMDVTGIYQDGLGTYQNVGWVQEDLRFKALCADNRDLVALLPSEAIALLPPGEWNTCQGRGGLNTIQLNIPALLNASTGVVGQDPGFNGVKYYFLIDSNFDGTFGSGDAAVNIFWHGGIYLTRTELTNPNRTVYELTTGLTSHYAEVRSGGVSLGTFCIPVRLTVTRLK